VKLATLLYIKNSNGDFLLLERAKNPNKGLLSPPGGKLETEEGESPFGCAVREAKEECNIDSKPEDWKLIGIITEKEYPNIGNIMLFLFEYRHCVNEIPREINEGKFRFVNPSQFNNENIPETDKLFIWDFVLRSTQTLFSLHLDCSNDKIECTIEQR